MKLSKSFRARLPFYCILFATVCATIIMLGVSVYGQWSLQKLTKTDPHWKAWRIVQIICLSFVTLPASISFLCIRSLIRGELSDTDESEVSTATEAKNVSNIKIDGTDLPSPPYEGLFSLLELDSECLRIERRAFRKRAPIFIGVSTLYFVAYVCIATAPAAVAMPFLASVMTAVIGAFSLAWAIRDFIHCTSISLVGGVLSLDQSNTIHGQSWKSDSFGPVSLSKLIKGRGSVSIDLKSVSEHPVTATFDGLFISVSDRLKHVPLHLDRESCVWLATCIEQAAASQGVAQYRKSKGS